MSMVFREIASDLLSGRRENGMDVSTPAVMRLNTFRNGFLRLDIFQNRFASKGNADQIVILSELQIAANYGLD